MLNLFLERAAATAFVDGQTDCALTVADWVVVCGHDDPADDLRGTYGSPIGRLRVLRRLGGLEQAMSDRLTGAGLLETANPVRGDVGVIVLAGRPLAAICLGDGQWAAKSNGVWVGRPDGVTKAWAVGAGGV